MCLGHWIEPIFEHIISFNLTNIGAFIPRTTLQIVSTVTVIVLTFICTINLLKMFKIRPKSKQAIVWDSDKLANIGEQKVAIDYSNQSIVDISTMERLPKYLPNGFQVNKLMTNLFEDATTMLESMERGTRLNGDGNCLGRIDNVAKLVTWINYQTVMKRITNFGNGLYHILDGAKIRNQTNGMFPCIGIYSKNCPEYVIAEYGCYWQSLVVVPIYDTLGPHACSFISNQAEIECIVCDKLERVQIILSEAHTIKSLRFLIVFDNIPSSIKQKAENHGIKLVTIHELEQIGSINSVLPNKPNRDDLAVICYTSGTTDTPKGVMLNHGNIIANVSAVMYQMMEYTIRMDDCMMSYLPLAHMFERCCENALFMVGGSIVYFSGDVKQLSDDMKIAMPTLLPAVPRLLTRIYCKIQDSVKSNVMKSLLLNTAFHFKQKNFTKTGIVRNDTFWDKLVFHKIRDTLGGKVRLIMCGSAPLNPNVLEFLRCALGCVVLEGYGQTECVAPCTCTFPNDIQSGHVGPPLSAAKIKLADVPEMGYYAKDGKGEILVQGPIVFQGYFKDPERTAQTLDNDGWLHTGDIGLFNDNETLKIIDRKKNIFKLSQGEYIAPEKIENIYSQCSLVAQIFVYGESLKSTLVAIVVPDQAAIESWCRANNVHDDQFKAQCCNKAVKTEILRELHLLGQRDGLKSFEQVKDIHVHHEMFSIENGLITPTLKTKREEIYKHFRSEIDRMYSRLE